MTKVLFTHTYFYKFDPKQWSIGEPFPPLMTITAAALLRDNGFDVSLFDVALRDSPDEILPVLQEVKPDYVVIFDDGFNYLTKMCLTVMRDAAFVMQGHAKDSGATVITCSSDSTDHYQEYLEKKSDFVIRGEGELVLLELLQAFKAGQDIRSISGIAFRDGADLIVNPKKQVIKELDSLPMAAWDLVDVESYRKVWNERGKKLYFNMATTRGCPYKCNWCAKPIYGNRYNSRSAEKVVDEIEYHIRHHQVDHFWMCDDIFGLKPGWAQEFRSELEKRKLKIHYKIQSRADLLLENDNIQALVDSGLDEAWIGAESGSQKILDAMDKGTTVSQIEIATSLLKANGVKVGFFIQYGYLGEDMEDIQATLRMVRQLLPDSLGISVSYPLPGTSFYEKVKSDLGTKSNWKDSDDLDMMFQNTYSKSFYRELHTYTHRMIAHEKGLKNITKPMDRFASGHYIKSVLKTAYNLPRLYLSRKKLHKLSKTSQ